MANETAKFVVHVDLADVRAIYEKYGAEASEAVIAKILDTLKLKINKALDLKTCDTGKKLLVEG